jgi:hypothetical protein
LCGFPGLALGLIQRRPHQRQFVRCGTQSHASGFKIALSADGAPSPKASFPTNLMITGFCDDANASVNSPR